MLKLFLICILVQQIEYTPNFQPGLSEAANNAALLATAISNANTDGGAVILPAGDYHLAPTILSGNKMYDIDGLKILRGAGRYLTTLRLPQTQATQEYSLFAVQSNSDFLEISGFTIHGPLAPTGADTPGFNPDLHPNTRGIYFETYEIGTSIIRDFAILGGFKTAINGNRNNDHPGKRQDLQVRHFEIETYHDGISWFSSSDEAPSLTVENGTISSGSPGLNGGLGRGGNIYVHPHVPLKVRDVNFLENYRRAIQFNGSSNPDVPGEYLIEDCYFGPNTNVGVLLSDTSTGVVRNCTFLGKFGLQVRNTVTVKDSYFECPVNIENYGTNNKAYHARIYGNTFVNGSVSPGSTGATWTLINNDFVIDGNTQNISGALNASQAQTLKLIVKGGSFKRSNIGSNLSWFVNFRQGEIDLDGVTFSGSKPFSAAVNLQTGVEKARVYNCTFDFDSVFESRAFWNESSNLYGSENVFDVDRVMQGSGGGFLIPLDREIRSVTKTTSSSIDLDPNVKRYLVTGGGTLKTLNFGTYSDCIVGPISLTCQDALTLDTGGNILTSKNIAAGDTVVLQKHAAGWSIQQ